MNKLKPLGDRLIVKRMEANSETESGLYIPESAKEKPQMGKVIAAGKGKINDNGTIQPMNVVVGDVILFGKYSGQEINVDSEELLIMREDDVYGVFGEENNEK